MGWSPPGGISALTKSRGRAGLFPLLFAMLGQPSANKEAGLTRNWICLLFDLGLPGL